MNEMINSYTYGNFQELLLCTGAMWDLATRIAKRPSFFGSQYESAARKSGSPPPKRHTQLRLFCR